MFKYEIENDEVIITGYKDHFVKSIVIPETIDGYPVTRIDDRAFTRQYYLKDINIPKTVTCIESGAFSGCINLSIINGVKLKEGVNNVNIINNRFIYRKHVIFKIKHQIGYDYITHHHNQYFIDGKYMFDIRNN